MREQCSRCWVIYPVPRNDAYCKECRKEYTDAYPAWVANGRQGRVLPPYPDPKRGPKPVRKRAATMSTRVSQYVHIYNDDVSRRGQHAVRMPMKARQAILRAQDGKCALCGEQISIRSDGPGRVAELDHDHLPPYTLRGYLCSLCNRGIGMLQDDPDLLEAAARYIRKFRQG